MPHSIKIVSCNPTNQELSNQGVADVQQEQNVNVQEHIDYTAQFGVPLARLQMMLRNTACIDIVNFQNCLYPVVNGSDMCDIHTHSFTGNGAAAMSTFGRSNTNIC